MIIFRHRLNRRRNEGFLLVRAFVRLVRAFVPLVRAFASLVRAFASLG